MLLAVRRQALQCRTDSSSASFPSFPVGLAIGNRVLIWPTIQFGPRVSMVVYSVICIGICYSAHANPSSH